MTAEDFGVFFAQVFKNESFVCKSYLSVCLSDCPSLQLPPPHLSRLRRLRIGYYPTLFEFLLQGHLRTFSQELNLVSW
jgi:hypothetical protein